jgi:hypothetical protein
LTFKVRGPGDPEIDITSPLWTYGAETQSLEISITSDDMWFVDHGGRGFAVADKDSPNGEYEAQNAFGARIRVTEHTEDEAGIVEETGQLDGAPSEYTWHIKLQPNQARAVLQALQVKVFAVVSSQAKHPIVCNDTTLDPTFSNPEKKHVHTCALLANIRQVSLIGVPNGVSISGPDNRSPDEVRTTRELNRLKLQETDH